MPWNDLGIGGSRRIVIAADGGQVAEAIRRCIGQVAHLGRRYVLAETVVPNTFHPKLIARLSEEGGRVWIGSGNLTYTGWGGNREVATSWSVGPEEDDKGVWLDEIFGAVTALVRSATFSDHLRAIRDEIPWLTQRLPSANNTPVLVGLPDRPLAPQLAERWRDRRFDDLKLCTGSTDTEGAFLLWAHRTFGIERATVCLSPAFSSFDPARLAKLPFEVRFIKATPEQLMHAKFYWFSGPGGHAAVVGSANCSAAAWLVGGGRGNVELVAPYDQPSASEFEPVLTIFNESTLSAQTALPPKLVGLNDEVSIAAARYRLASVRLRSARIIEVVFEPPLSANAQVNLTVQSSSASTTVKLTPQARGLIGRLPVEFDIGSTTNFAFAEVISSGDRYVTEPRWIDNETLLNRASNPRQLDPTLQDLSRRSLFTSDQQRILEAVQAVSAQLLKGHDHPAAGKASQAALRRAETDATGDGDAIHAPLAIDPSTMIRSLNDLRLEHRTNPLGRLAVFGGTLEGIIGLLFAQQEEEDVDLSRETWTAAEPEKNPYDIGSTADDPNVPTDDQTPPPQATSLETLATFREQLNTFLAELAKPQFAETCDAARLVQALAFPLLLCVRGSEAGWLRASELASAAARVVEIMLDRHYGSAKPRGLLRMVESRYAKLGRDDDFHRLIGEGTLWAALLAALAGIPTTPLRIVIPQAAALTAAFGCKELLAVADADHLSVLINSLLIKDAEANITERAAKIADAMALLTKALTDRWDAKYEEQGSGRRLQAAGSVLWSRDWGWSIVPSSPAQAFRPGYINLERAAENCPEIARAIEGLVDACK